MAVAVVKGGFTGGILGTQKVRAKRDLREMGFLYLSLVAFIVIVAACFVYLGSRLAYFNTGYETADLGRERTVLIEKNKRLRVELERLRSPERIERIATVQLGLGYPAPNQVLRIR